MNAEEKILQASLDAMRELSIEQLRAWKTDVLHDVEHAVAATYALIDHVIAEKLAARRLN